jgi:hypothetical protein
VLRRFWRAAVVQAMLLLEADLARSWTLTSLAAELHLAPGYLVRLFNAATGLPPWPTWASSAPSTPPSCSCTPTSRSPASGARSAGRPQRKRLP